LLLNFKYLLSICISMGVLDLYLRKIKTMPRERYGLPTSKEFLDLYHEFSYQTLAQFFEPELLYPLTVQEPVVSNDFGVSDVHGTLGYCNELEPLFDSTLFKSKKLRYKKNYGNGVLVYSEDNLIGFWKLSGARTFMALQHTVNKNGKTLLVPGGVYNPFFDRYKLHNEDKVPYKNEFRKAEIGFLVDEYLSRQLFPVRMFRFHLYGGNSYLDKLLERKKELE